MSESDIETPLELRNDWLGIAELLYLIPGSAEQQWIARQYT